MKHLPFSLVPCAALALALLTACGGGGSGTPAPVPAPAPVRPSEQNPTFNPPGGAPGTLVVITGVTGATQVLFGGVPAENFKYTGTNEITVTVPAAARSGAITVVTAAGPRSTATTFTVPAIKPGPALTATRFDPDRGLPGSVLALTGTGLDQVTQVQFGDVPTEDFEVRGPDRIQVFVPAGIGPTVTIQVVGSAGAIRFPGLFTVLAPPPPVPPGPPEPPPPVPALALTGMDPDQGFPGQTVTLTGSGLTAASLVRFGGVAARSLRSLDDTTLEAVVPAAAVTGPVTVATPLGQATLAGPFTVLVPPPPPALAPEITGLDAASARPGAQLRITGQHFTGTTQVRFSRQVAAFTQDPATQDSLITATVPRNPGDCTVVVHTAAGTGRAPVSFRILPAPSPAVTDIDPRQAWAGAPVIVRGSAFTGLLSVAFAGVPAPAPTLVADGEIHVTVPAGAGDGPVTVTTADGSGSSPFAFQVIPAPPAITAINPAAGAAAGVQVEILGSGFLPAARVFFNGVEDPLPALVTPGRILARVPAGATSGPVRVENGPASAASFPFTVTAAAPVLAVSLQNWYITQATQAPDRSVPLVAGRDGLLRVFLQATMANTATPALRATLSHADGSSWTRTIHAPGAAVPVTPREGVLQDTWNLRVPGAELRPGTTLRLELDPGNTVPGADHSGDALARALEVRTVAPVRITLVPVTQANGNTGDITRGGRTEADWVDLFRRLYPVATVDVQVGAPLLSAETLDPDDDGTWARLNDELDARRISDGANDRFYYGVVRLGWSAGTIGLTTYGTFSGQPFATGTDAPATYKVTLAHEMGHVLGRDHAPCGGVTHAPGNWPDTDPRYRNAQIGVYGFDLATGQLKDPAVCTDIMAYCNNVWISDWTYKGVLDWRRGNAGGPFAAFRAPAHSAPAAAPPRP